MSTTTRLIRRCYSSSTRSRSLSTSSETQRFAIPSIGFSGAGFLGAYHTGVAACLLKHNHLLQPMERINHNETDATRPPILAGVSAGGIISAAISAGVKPDDAMGVLYEINDRTKNKSNIILDSLTPGFSLVDQVEDLLFDTMKEALGGSRGTDNLDDYDNDLLLNRIDHGRLLHIGMADRRRLVNPITQKAAFYSSPPIVGGNDGERNSPFIKGNLDMYIYPSQYRDLKDVVSASILSSYVPIGTGPLRSNNGTTSKENTAVKRAFDRMKEMEDLGYLKHYLSGEIIGGGNSNIEQDDNDRGNGSSSSSSSSPDDDSYYWDGGIVNMFPSIDKSTIMVTPLNCKFSPNPYIAPEAQSDTTKYVNVDDKVSMGMNMQNVKLLLKMLRSSDPSYLEERFHEGYDNTTQFLKERDLLRVF